MENRSELKKLTQCHPVVRVFSCRWGTKDRNLKEGLLSLVLNAEVRPEAFKH